MGGMPDSFLGLVVGAPGVRMVGRRAAVAVERAFGFLRKDNQERTQKGGNGDSEGDFQSESVPGCAAAEEHYPADKRRGEGNNQCGEHLSCAVVRFQGMA